MRHRVVVSGPHRSTLRGIWVHVRRACEGSDLFDCLTPEVECWTREAHGSGISGQFMYEWEIPVGWSFEMEVGYEEFGRFILFCPACGPKWRDDQLRRKLAREMAK